MTSVTGDLRPRKAPKPGKASALGHKGYGFAVPLTGSLRDNLVRPMGGKPHFKILASVAPDVFDLAQLGAKLLAC